MSMAIPDIWRTVPVSAILERRRENVLPAAFPNETFNFVGLEHIDGGGLGGIEIQEVSGSEVLSQKTRFRAGDVLYGKLRPYLNKVAIAPRDGVCSTEIWAFHPHSVIDSEFAFYALGSPSFVQRVGQLTLGANLPRANAEPFDAIQVALPPLSEQRQIVEVLHEAEEIRRLRGEADRKTAELIPALFHKMFGDPFSNSRQWPTDTIRSLAEKISDGPFGSNLKSSHYTEPGVRVVRLQNIGVGEFLDYDKAFISEAHFKTLAKHECVTDDVLIGTLGDPNLRACLLPAFVGRALNKADCVQFRANTARVTPEYACWLLNMPGTLRLAARQIAGQGRFRISMGRLAEVEVPVPPLRLQGRFSMIVREVMSLRSDIASSSEQSKSLRASLLARAFTGELTAEWRKTNADVLRPEVRERDEALAVVGVRPYRRSTIQEDLGLWTEPTGGSNAELSHEQARLFHELSRYFNYPSSTGLFSAQAVADQLGDVFGISTDAVRRHLEVFAARGLLLRTTRERPSAELAEFAVLYRRPHLSGDDSEDGDDRRVAELLKLAAKIAPKFKRVAE